MATILLVDDEPFQALDRKTALEQRFPDVERVADAAEALCLIEEPRFANNLRLVIAGNHAPGFGGPQFVSELKDRLPELNVLVIGNRGERFSDYAESEVHFLPRRTSANELVAEAEILLDEDESFAA